MLKRYLIVIGILITIFISNNEIFIGNYTINDKTYGIFIFVLLIICVILYYVCNIIENKSGDVDIKISDISDSKINIKVDGKTINIKPNNRKGRRNKNTFKDKIKMFAKGTNKK